MQRKRKNATGEPTTRSRPATQVTTTGWARLRGSPAHRRYTVTVFIVLAALDNVAIALPPPLLSPISSDLGVREPAVGSAVAVSFLVTAVAAVFWAYLGDRTDRKRLLMIGTVIWAVGVGATSVATAYPAFLAAMALAGIGLGTVASVGFSVVSDLIAPKRRGLVMGLWGLSQGLGSLVGTGLGSVVGADNWRLPFRILMVVGVLATVAYLFTLRIPRGQSEPELAKLYEQGGEYAYRIRASDLPGILRRRANLWIAAQGLTAQITFGSLFWLPRLLQAKAEALGYPEATAIRVGGVFTVLLLSGGVLSLVGAMVGDRVQRRRPGGRALVAGVGVLASVPLFVALFFFPLRLDLSPAETEPTAIVWGVLRSLVTEPVMALTFLVALLAIMLMSANGPNWFALVAEVNPPEHRGTAFSLSNLVQGVGRTIGTDVTVRTFDALARVLPPPANFAVGMAVLQLFFIPTGIMFLLAARSSPRDIATVNLMMRRRAAQAEPAPDGAPARSHHPPTRPSKPHHR